MSAQKPACMWKVGVAKTGPHFHHSRRHTMIDRTEIFLGLAICAKFSEETKSTLDSRIPPDVVIYSYVEVDDSHI